MGDQEYPREMYALVNYSGQGESEQIRLIEVPVPSDLPIPHHYPRKELVFLRTLFVGVCGEERNFFHLDSRPLGPRHIIRFHEAVLEVVEADEAATGLKPGQYVVPMVRRPLPDSYPTLREWTDDNYWSRGTGSYDGFGSEFVVDHKDFLVPVPKELGIFAVLIEPLSIAEHLDRVILSNSPQQERPIAIIGIGAIGLLVATVCRLRGYDVMGFDIVDPSNLKAQILQHTLRGRYVSLRVFNANDPLAVIKAYPEYFDVVVECAGKPSTVALASALPRQGGRAIQLGLTERVSLDPSSPHSQAWMEDSLKANKILDTLVRSNRTRAAVCGLASGKRVDYEQAIVDIQQCQQRYPMLLNQLIHKISLQDFERNKLPSLPPNLIKAVINFQC